MKRAKALGWLAWPLLPFFAAGIVFALGVTAIILWWREDFRFRAKARKETHDRRIS